MRFGSLFSGIGGMDLGLEQAGMECAWQVETDEFCRRVLAKHWPNVPKFNDVREVGKHNLEPVDLIAGGFPCQDISFAGKGKGIDGARSGLWSEFYRIICELRPQYVLVENVAALLKRGMGRVLGDLAAGGYDAEWERISACSFGAAHRRKRVFIIAYPSSRRRQGIMRKGILQEVDDISLKALGTWNDARHPFADTAKLLASPGYSRLPDGVSSTLAIRPALQGYGNAVVPCIAKWIGQQIIERETNELQVSS